MLSYRRDLQRYLLFLAASGRTAVGDITATDVSDYLATLRMGSDGHPALAASSAARAVVAARGWHRFLLAEGAVGADASRDVRPPAPARRLPKALPVDTITALLDAASGTDPRGLRDRALLELLYATGARISEAVGLDVDDVDDLGRTVDGPGGSRVVSVVRLRGKGSKERLVPVGSYRRSGRAGLSGPRPAQPRRGRPQRPGQRGSAVPEQPRRPAVPAERLAGAAGHRGTGRHPGRATTSPVASRRTPCGIPSPPTCWKAAPTSGRSRNCSGTPRSPPRRSTRWSPSNRCVRCTRRRTRGLGRRSGPTVASSDASRRVDRPTPSDDLSSREPIRSDYPNPAAAGVLEPTSVLVPVATTRVSPFHRTGMGSESAPPN